MQNQIDKNVTEIKKTKPAQKRSNTKNQKATAKKDPTIDPLTEKEKREGKQDTLTNMKIAEFIRFKKSPS